MSTWTAEDELRFLDYMVSDKPRGERRVKLTKADKRKRLETWLDHFETRRFPDGNYRFCLLHARQLLKDLV